MKVDKDFLTKNLFWVLTGSFLVIFLIPLCMVVFAMSPKADKKKYEESWDTVKKLDDFKNDKFVKVLEAKEKELEAQKKAVWQQGWDKQNAVVRDKNTGKAVSCSPLVQWLGDPRSYPKGGKLNEWITEAHLADKALDKYYFANDPKDQQYWPLDPGLKGYDPQGDEFDYRVEWPTLYQKQLDRFPDLIKPAYYYTSWEQVVQPQKKWPQKPASPSAEECWYSQEDLCVRHELLLMVKEAMESAGRFRDPAEFQKLDNFDQEPLVQVFQNPNWQVELAFEEAGEEGKKEVSLKAAKLTKMRDEKHATSDAAVKVKVQQRDKDGKARAPVVLELAAGALNQPMETKVGKALAGFQLQEPVEVRLADEPPKPQQGVLVRKRLRNAVWELDLLIGPGARRSDPPVVLPASRLINVHPGKRTLQVAGIDLKVKQGTKEKVIKVQGESIIWDDGKELKDLNVKEPVALSDFDLGRGFEVEQVLTWPTSPVKRVDRLELGNFLAQSHRTAIRPIVPRMKLDDLPAALARTTTGTGPGGELPLPKGGTPPPERGGENTASPDGSGGEATKDPAKDNKDWTLNSVYPRKRYASQTDQVRRLPVGVVLVVDQAHVQEVLAVFTPGNSRLRFHPTQVIWQHTRSVPPPPEETKPDARAPDDTRRLPGDDRTPSRDGRSGGGATLDERGPGYGGPVPLPGVVEEDDPNLVEVQIYGLVSIFERYPKLSLTKPSGEQPKDEQPKDEQPKDEGRK